MDFMFPQVYIFLEFALHVSNPDNGNFMFTTPYFRKFEGMWSCSTNV
jgi:hypothetical protein